MPLQATSGAASYDGFGGGVPFTPTYIEDVFSTWLYTGTGSTQTITNGIDLAGKGGLTWFKNRTGANYHLLFDTDRGVGKEIYTNTTDAQSGPYSPNQTLQSFNSNGFTIGTNSSLNGNGSSIASWTFRKQPKFFDVVTWTGNGTGSRAISHALDSTPGCIIFKRTDSADDWWVVHRSASNFGNYAVLNSTAAFTSSINSGISSVGSTSFTVSSYYNSSGATWVAYVFGHNAGGFGLTGTDNVITCGSFVGTGALQSITLGYEPQWILFKRAVGATDNWRVLDNMRGWSITSQQFLFPNSADAEAGSAAWGSPTATGMNILGSNGDTYIYIAIRRGPMRTPTTGTSVFDPEAYTGTSATRTITSGFPVDLSASKIRSQGYPGGWFDRLRGALQVIRPSSTDAEATSADSLTGFDSMTGVVLGSDGSGRINTSPDTYAMWNFRRAPGFFDVVCYTGNNVYQQAQSHNLGVAPELIIVKRRDSTANWAVGCNFTNTEFQYLNLNSGADGGNTNAYTTGGFFGGRPTATTFILAQNSITNASGGTYVAYLFATLAGVSKVGTYTGTGTTLQIDCGFTGGARFVLIKRLGTNTDAGTGDWYVWDSARGIVSGNDPYLLLNSTAAEVTNTDYVDTYSAGFEISSTAPAAINANGGSFIFLAIA